MEILMIPLLTFSLLIPILVVIRVIKKANEQPCEEYEEEEDDEVRAVVYKAYSALNKKHTPNLHWLTACLSQTSIPTNVALYALLETEKAIQEHYDTRPIKLAIEAIEGMGE